MDTDQYLSWGRVHRYRHDVRRLDWRTADRLAALRAETRPLLAFGLGRSYGDSCLNDGGVLVDMGGLRRLISFDAETGVLRAEAGTSLADVLRFAVPRGYFLPVTPGTKYVTLGGAVANDVHGKNHHGRGTFGRHVRRLAVWRSDGTVTECSPTESAELFRATVGGLGLTGLILWVEIELRPITSSAIEVETIRFESLDEFLEIERESTERFEYTVSWVDTLAPGGKARGHFMRGRHADGDGARDLVVPRGSSLVVPVEAPELLLGSLSMRVFNELFYRKQLAKRKTARVSYEPFFYPLDGVLGWNKLYGRRGFFQFQCAVPMDRVDTFREILRRISASRNGSFLAVMKTFGPLESPGILSFPRPGLTLTLDFANRGERTLDLLRGLDELVREAGGRLYPAKDSTMSKASFAAAYPEARELARVIDPRFSSSFWRRVT